MKTPVIAGAIILGLGAVTFALARQDSVPPAPPASPAPSSSETPRGDRAELYARVAKLRAEVEMLQLEHDLARAQLSAGLKERAGGEEASPSRQTAREYLRIGAEIVGKAAEFESAMQERGDEIWKAVDRAVAAPAPADIDRLKREFLRVATELNRKKIDLVELEVHLDGSM